MKNRNTGIYAILNKNTGKYYIGSTNNIYRRRREHFWELRNGIHLNPYIQNAFNKYGEESFIFIVLSRGVPIDQLYLKEREVILYMESSDGNFGYNLSIPTGDGGPQHNTITKEKLRKLAYIQFHGEYDEVKYQVWKDKLQEKKDKPKLDRRKPILQVCTKTGKILNKFPSIAETQKQLGVSISAVEKTIDKKCKRNVNYLRIKGCALVSADSYTKPEDYIWRSLSKIK